MALTLRPPPQVYFSPSSAQTNLIIKPLPPSFIWHQGIRALQ